MNHLNLETLYQRLTKKAEALIAAVYLSGTNTRRVKRALYGLFKGAVSKDVVSRAWRKVSCAALILSRAAIDTTRRALDPEQLGAHVADNIDHFMGPVAQNFVRAIEANSDSAKHNLNAAQQTISAAKDIEDKAKKLDMESRALASIAERLEERDTRSKWDWATLGAAMIVAAGLAGGGAVYFTKQELDNANFADATGLRGVYLGRSF